MSKRLFIKKFLFNNRETGSILPSSNTLANKMVTQELINNSNVIIELGAGGGIFTGKIFEYTGNDIINKKIFIIEKDKDFYELLLKRFPRYSNYIYNIDVLKIGDLLNEKGIKTVDLVISGLPFKSLPKNIFDFLMTDLFKKIFNKNTVFIQFSYFRKFSNDLNLYFDNIKINTCYLNIPTAHIFSCQGFKNEK